MSVTVKDILSAKGCEVTTIAASASVLEAMRLMRERGIGSLVVTARPGQISGIIAERDCLWNALAEGRSPRSMLVREAMTPIRKLRTVAPDESVSECMNLMTDSRQRHVPVMDGKKLVGLISIGDVVKFLLGDQQATIQSLEKYIEGSL